MVVGCPAVEEKARGKNEGAEEHERETVLGDARIGGEAFVFEIAVGCCAVKEDGYDHTYGWGGVV